MANVEGNPYVGDLLNIVSHTLMDIVEVTCYIGYLFQNCPSYIEGQCRRGPLRWLSIEKCPCTLMATVEGTS